MLETNKGSQQTIPKVNQPYHLADSMIWSSRAGAQRVFQFLGVRAGSWSLETDQLSDGKPIQVAAGGPTDQHRVAAVINQQGVHFIHDGVVEWPCYGLQQKVYYECQTILTLHLLS